MNIEEIKAKLKAAQNGKPTKAIWKPKSKHTVRLLPLPGEADITEVILWHYGVDDGRKMYCPATTGEQCSFCDLAQSLRGWRDADGNEKTEADRARDWEAFKKIQSATKYYAPIVVRKDTEDEYEGPFWWEMTPKVRERLLTICADDDWNAQHKEDGGSRILTSLTQGLDLTVVLKKAGQDGNSTSYDLTEVTERKVFSTFFKSKGAKAAKEVLESIPDLKGAVQVVTSQQVEKVFASWEAGLSDGGNKAESSGTEHGNPNAEKTLSGGKSVQEVLDKLDSLIPKEQPKQA